MNRIRALIGTAVGVAATLVANATQVASAATDRPIDTASIREYLLPTPAIEPEQIERLFASQYRLSAAMAGSNTSYFRAVTDWQHTSDELLESIGRRI